MCFEEKNDEIKKQFVTHAMEKRGRNKRKRDPDMYVDVLLSCTVKRLKCEMVNKDYTRKPWKERENSPSWEENRKEDLPEPTKEDTTAEDEVEMAVECLQSALETLDKEEKYSVGNANDAENSIENSTNNQCTVDSSFIEESRTFADPKLPLESSEYTKCEDLDFDTLMQSLLEICEPLTCNLDELMKEYSIDPNNSGPLDLLSSSDPFLPGMFEVMCS